MKVIDRIKRDKKMLQFLATPVQHDDGTYLKNNKGEYVYPSLRDTSLKYDLSEESISRTKRKNLAEFESFKKETFDLIMTNQDLTTGE